VQDLWESIREHLTTWSIEKLYITCAIAGGAVLLIQLGLSVLGIGDADVDIEDTDVSAPGAGEAGEGMNILSLRALASFLTLFGLIGWHGTSSEWSQPVTALVAVACGVGMMLLVAWMMRGLVRLSESGNLDPQQAVGKVATVYLRIPARGGGKGKITVSIQGRSAEFSAVTTGGELPTGTECRVIAMRTGEVFEVEPIGRDQERQ
jgi:hypothetical protein